MADLGSTLVRGSLTVTGNIIANVTANRSDTANVVSTYANARYPLVFSNSNTSGYVQLQQQVSSANALASNITANPCSGYLYACGVSATKFIGNLASYTNSSTTLHYPTAVSAVNGQAHYCASINMNMCTATFNANNINAATSMYSPTISGTTITGTTVNASTSMCAPCFIGVASNAVFATNANYSAYGNNSITVRVNTSVSTSALPIAVVNTTSNGYRAMLMCSSVNVNPCTATISAKIINATTSMCVPSITATSAILTNATIGNLTITGSINQEEVTNLEVDDVTIELAAGSTTGSSTNVGIFRRDAGANAVAGLFINSTGNFVIGSAVVETDGTITSISGKEIMVNGGSNTATTPTVATMTSNQVQLTNFTIGKSVPTSAVFVDNYLNSISFCGATLTANRLYQGSGTTYATSLTATIPCATSAINGVMNNGAQTIAGVKTFSSTISGNILSATNSSTTVHWITGVSAVNGQAHYCSSVNFNPCTAAISAIYVNAGTSMCSPCFIGTASNTAGVITVNFQYTNVNFTTTNGAAANYTDRLPLLFSSSNTAGNLTVYQSNVRFTVNACSGVMYAPTFSGTLSGRAAYTNAVYVLNSIGNAEYPLLFTNLTNSANAALRIFQPTYNNSSTDGTTTNNATVRINPCTGLLIGKLGCFTTNVTSPCFIGTASNANYSAYGNNSITVRVNAVTTAANYPIATVNTTSNGYRSLYMCSSVNINTNTATIAATNFSGTRVSGTYVNASTSMCTPTLTGSTSINTPTLNVTRIQTNLVSTYWNLATNGANVIINSTASAGSFVALSKLVATDGVFIDGIHQGNRLIIFASNNTIANNADANSPTNSVDKTIYLLTNTGLTQLLDVKATGTLAVTGATTLSSTLMVSGNTTVTASNTTSTYNKATTLINATGIYISFNSNNASTWTNYISIQLNSQTNTVTAACFAGTASNSNAARYVYSVSNNTAANYSILGSNATGSGYHNLLMCSSVNVNPCTATMAAVYVNATTRICSPNYYTTGVITAYNSSANKTWTQKTDSTGNLVFTCA